MAPKPPKLPVVRGFTMREVRAMAIERRTFHLTWVVAVLAATMSFVALRWVGVQSSMPPWIAPLLPLAIDGLGIICSFGIIRSAGAGEPFKRRASEWVGLGFSLTLSMLGNGSHALGYVPPWLKLVYAVAVPGIVAYSIHVLGRYMESGVSAHVLADEPDKIHFDLRQLGDTDDEAAARVQPQRAPAPRTPAPAPRTQPPRTVITEPARAQAQRAPEPARTEPVEDAPAQPFGPAAAAVDAARQPTEEERVRALFDAAVARDPRNKPIASVLHEQAGVTRDKATTRRWVQKWWTDLQESLGESDPIAEQLDNAPQAEEKDTADVA